MYNGAELGGATGAMAPLVFWSRSLKKSRNQSLVVSSGTSCFYLRSAPMSMTQYVFINLRVDCPCILHRNVIFKFISYSNLFYRSRSQNSRHSRDRSPGDPKKMLPEALTKQCLVRCRVSY